MKQTFNNLPDEKKNRIITACVEEFSKNGYEKSSTESIIKKAGISKGGLYEYIDSKKELYIFIVNYTYEKLYSYLRKKIEAEHTALPSDILDRFKVVSDIAIDFYIEHPEYVKLIVKTYKIHDVDIENRVKNIFSSEFMSIFDSIDNDSVKYDKIQIFDLLMWLLSKTRYDFLIKLDASSDPSELKKDYQDNWDFFFSVLKNGIYK
jgi:TetR/AcrR family transcriptional regulator